MPVSSSDKAGIYEYGRVRTSVRWRGSAVQAGAPENANGGEEVSRRGIVLRRREEVWFGLDSKRWKGEGDQVGSFSTCGCACVDVGGAGRVFC